MIGQLRAAYGRHVGDPAWTHFIGRLEAASPDFAPLFSIAAALVTDSGGSLCHAAMVAREYGLPAVVGARVASRARRN